jgi:nucleotidyltransferase/DNA polymerase involved in DNA repair
VRVLKAALQSRGVEMRIGCILIRRFVVQLAMKHNPELEGREVIVSDFDSDLKVVLDASPGAMACGVKPGMSTREACSVCPEAVLLQADEDECQQVFERVLSILDRFSPAVEAAGLGRAYLDVTGLGNEVELARAMRSTTFRETGLSACVGIASGKFFSWLAALTSRAEGPVVVPQGLEKEFVAPFSIGLLPCSTVIKERLKLFGIQTVGEVSRFTREALVAQFGGEGSKVYDIARGVDVDPLVPRSKPEVICGGVQFNMPAESYLEILRGCEWVLDRLLVRARTPGKVCRGIRLRLRLISGLAKKKSLPLKEASASKESLISRLRASLEGANFPEPVDKVELALVLDHEKGRRVPLWPEHGMIKEELARAIVELKKRFGHQPLRRVAAVEAQSLIAEKRFRLIDFDQEV